MFYRFERKTGPLLLPSCRNMMIVNLESLTTKICFYYFYLGFKAKLGRYTLCVYTFSTNPSECLHRLKPDSVKKDLGTQVQICLWCQRRGRKE